MARVIIPDYLEKEICKKFRGESKKIFELMLSLGDNPLKGKLLAVINNFAIKELKYKSFRFYFLVDSFKIKFVGIEELHDLLIKFVRMSDKNTQQKVINEIKEFLRNL